MSIVVLFSIKKMTARRSHGSLFAQEDSFFVFAPPWWKALETASKDSQKKTPSFCS